MIKKLRKKFIMVTAMALFGVIAVLMTSINVIYILKSEKSLNHILNIITENDGRLLVSDKEFIPKKELNDVETNNNFGSGKYRGNREIVFTTRFCVVDLDVNKQITNIYSEKISAISDTEIEEYTEKILKRDKLNGWIDEYKYKLSESNDGYMLVILDGSMAKQSNWSIFTTSILVSTISYLIVLFIIALFSKKAIKPIAEGYEKQKQFITDASHELKTPLTIISANSEILEMTYGNDEWIEGIEKQAERMRDLVNNLVVLTKMDEEKQTIIYKEFSVSDAVYDTAMAFEGLCKKNKKKLHINVNSDINMKGDESEFRKLISILLDNAVKYCDEYGNIYVTLKKDKNIVMSVRNSYENVSKIELNRLFDRFYRVDKARTRNGSYGLGLSIAQAIIDRHKGKVKVINIDDKMIGFEVKL